MSGNGNNLKSAETCLEKKVKITLIDPFLGGFKQFETIVQKGQQRITCQNFSYGTHSIYIRTVIL